MVQRLPIVNSDDGTWGDLLRNYLLKEHTDTGTDNASNGGHKNITITAGTASAGTAPIKFTSGTLLSTPEAGAMEFAGDHYYLTQTSSTTRKKIAMYDDTGGATGDIYYRNSSGYFTKLAIGASDGKVLTVSSGLPAWSNGPTLDNTSSITVKDANFTLQDNTTTSKQLQFELSGISASTTRTLTAPDASGTIALVGDYEKQELYHNFMTKSNGAVASTVDSGQAWTQTYSRAAGAPTISSGRYTNTDTASGSSAGYLTTQLSATATWLEMEFEFGSSGSTSGQSATLIAFASNLPTPGPIITAPDSPAHVVFTYNSVQWGVISGGSLTIIAVIPYKQNLTTELQRVAIGIDKETGKGWVLCPDGITYEVSHSLISSTTAPYVTFETFYTAADTDKRVNIRKVGADSTPFTTHDTKRRTKAQTLKQAAGAVSNPFIEDSKFTLHDSFTKFAKFELSGITSGNIRTLTIPDTDTTIAGTDATQTLTNKTLTAPKFADLGYIADASGNELLIFDSSSSAVNELTIQNGATGFSPSISSTGNDSDLDLSIFPKGSGKLAIYDGNDNSKKVKFDTSGLTTSTTRTLTIPDANGTITLNSSPDLIVEDVSGTTKSMSAGYFYINKNATPGAWTFPAVSSNEGNRIRIYNWQGGTISLTPSGSDQVYVGDEQFLAASPLKAPYESMWEFIAYQGCWLAVSQSGTFTGGTGMSITDQDDPTKQLRFDLSGITTATARTLTVPDANITLVGTTNTQTLSGKTISGSSNTLSNIALTSLTSDTTTALGIGSINLGHASDTTITRSAAGVIAVEGVTVPLNSTSSTHTAGTIELGAATDTTLSRSAAGVLAVEGVAVPTVSSTSTLTNKWIQPRVVSPTIASSYTINADVTDAYNVITQTSNVTFNNPTGTPVNFQKLWIRIKDDTTARTITWGTSFMSSGVATLPTTTISGKYHEIGLIYNSSNSKWVCIAVDATGY